jgi:hypothetical protein
VQGWLQNTEICSFLNEFGLAKRSLTPSWHRAASPELAPRVAVG